MRLSTKVLWSLLTLLISLPLFGETTPTLVKGSATEKLTPPIAATESTSTAPSTTTRFLYDLDSFKVHLSDTSPARGLYRMHRMIHLCRRNYA